VEVCESAKVSVIPVEVNNPFSGSLQGNPRVRVDLSVKKLGERSGN
jgi:hypothetical protein